MFTGQSPPVQMAAPGVANAIMSLSHPQASAFSWLDVLEAQRVDSGLTLLSDVLMRLTVLRYVGSARRTCKRWCAELDNLLSAAAHSVGNSPPEGASNTPWYEDLSFGGALLARFLQLQLLLLSE